MVNKQEINKTESFAELFAEQIKQDDKKEGQVVKGTIISIENDMIIIDVGYKTEGRINLREFSGKDNNKVPVVGDVIDVYLEKAENRFGEAVLSREKARREESWETLEKASEIKEKVNGTIFGRVKGGFSVDLDGAIAFLPGSQVDVRPTRDSNHLVGSTQLFHILKMDRRRGNIVVSRRSVLEESRAEAKAELVSTMEEGQVLDGIIKNITDYGAFVDLGEVDGLLHVTDISWKRISHPTEALSIGQKVKVQVIKFNSDTQRISLGMKQLEEDPWMIAKNKYKVDDKPDVEVLDVDNSVVIRKQVHLLKQVRKKRDESKCKETLAALTAAGYKGVVGTAESLSLPDRSVDLLIYGFCLYLCDRDDLFSIAAEAHRVLKPESWLAILDFWSPYQRVNAYHHRSGIESYKDDLPAMFSWHPSYVITDHRLRHHSTRAHTDDPQEWIGVTLLRRCDFISSSASRSF